MPDSDIKKKSLTIVLIGDFNPKIFQPAWFGAQGLIKAEEAENADIKIIHSDVVTFELKSWLNLTVTRDRFQIITTQEPYYEVVRDLVVSTFDLLHHTPITAMGINIETHIKMKSTDDWDLLGHQLTPKEFWTDILKEPGMLSLNMQGNREDSYAGKITVLIEPSKLVTDGVFIRVNDHYDVKEGCKEINNILMSNWDKVVEKSNKTVKNILEKHASTA